MMNNILFLVAGFVLGSVYTWYCLRKYGREMVVEDIKGFIDENKQKIVSAALNVKEIFKAKPEEIEPKIESGLIRTTYGSY